MTLLTIVGDVCKRTGITAAPSSVIGSTNTDAIKLLALAQQEGKELAKRHTWQKLTKEKTFTSSVSETQSGAIPSDFDRYIDDTFYNRTQKRPVHGPLNPQEWAYAKSVVATTIVESWRQRGDSVLITPTPTGTSDTYAYEYVSNQWCESSGGTDQSAWAADTDVGLLPEELMTLGIIWRFLESRGANYDEEFRRYELMIVQAISRDGGKPTLNAGRRASRRPGIYVPDGNWYS